MRWRTMRNCECGGELLRHGTTIKGGVRFRCKTCQKTFTVNEDGSKAQMGQQRIKDWRAGSPGNLSGLQEQINELRRRLDAAGIL